MKILEKRLVTGRFFVHEQTEIAALPIDSATEV